MKSLRICSALLTIAFAVPAFGQVSVYIGTPPPPIRYERRGPIPGPGFYGSKATGLPMVITIAGFRDDGNARHMKAHTGAIRITTTIGKDGNYVKAIGIAKTMTTATGGTTMTTTTITRQD